MINIIWEPFHQTEDTKSWVTEVNGVRARYGDYYGHYEYSVYDLYALRLDHSCGYSSTLAGARENAERAIGAFLRSNSRVNK